MRVVIEALLFVSVSRSSNNYRSVLECRTKDTFELAHITFWKKPQAKHVKTAKWYLAVTMQEFNFGAKGLPIFSDGTRNTLHVRVRMQEYT